MVSQRISGVRVLRVLCASFAVFVVSQRIFSRTNRPKGILTHPKTDTTNLLDPFVNPVENYFYQTS